jgi:hypothetical protein
MIGKDPMSSLRVPRLISRLGSLNESGSLPNMFEEAAGDAPSVTQL